MVDANPAKLVYVFLAGLAAIFAALFSSAARVTSEEALFMSQQLTLGEYTSGIEGPAVDADGNLYVVNFLENGTIGKLKHGAARSELFTKLPTGSVGNGIRFDRGGRMYIADYKKHNVFVIESGETMPHVFFHSDSFNQPNDLAIARDGTLYASDPDFGRRTGQIWRITRGPDGKGRGEVMRGERKFGITNGIDLSPGDETLYVSESNTREVWAYSLLGATLTKPRLLKRFDKFELDGLRTDIDGRIFVTRPGDGTIAVITSDGGLVREITLRGKVPSNLTFGGLDGKTIFVTQVDGRFVESFRVNRPGREHCFEASAVGCP